MACGRAHTLILTGNVQEIKIKNKLILKYEFIYTIYLLDCGQVFSCGNNDDGQLGVQDILCRDAPQEITSVSGIKQVSTGANHSTALNGKWYSVRNGA